MRISTRSFSFIVNTALVDLPKRSSKRTRIESGSCRFYPSICLPLPHPPVRHPSHGVEDGRSEGEEGKKRPRRSRPLTSFVTLISGSFVSGRVNERSRVILKRSLARVVRGEKINETKERGRGAGGSRDDGGSYACRKRRVSSSRMKIRRGKGCCSIIFRLFVLLMSHSRGCFSSSSSVSYYPLSIFLSEL